MAEYLGRRWTRSELLARVGDPQQVAGATRFTVENRTRGTAIEVSCDLSERQRRIVLAVRVLLATIVLERLSAVRRPGAGPRRHRPATR